MAYARKKKFWAPGHGNLHLSLESYTLCKDGNWHLLDTYNQKQPPFVMPLQVFSDPLMLPWLSRYTVQEQYNCEEQKRQQNNPDVSAMRIRDTTGGIVSG